MKNAGCIESNYSKNLCIGQSILSTNIDKLICQHPAILVPKIKAKTLYKNVGKPFRKDNPFESLCQGKQAQ